MNSEIMFCHQREYSASIIPIVEDSRWLAECRRAHNPLQGSNMHFAAASNCLSFGHFRAKYA